MSVKYIFITGGVVSGLGKGITAASLGRLLKARGYNITIQKFDPYINFDPGTMSPFQHGEVFVTDDGAETDLDLGHYERFTDENLSKNSNVTTGKVYWSVISKEREGAYLGRTVQVIPHITNEIKERIYRVGKDGKTDIVITEIGGTVGDMESLPFLEAIRQVSAEVGKENCMYIHVTLLPYLPMSGEQKTKPTQHSVKELLSIGIQPDVLVCRSSYPIEKSSRDKMGLFCNVSGDCVIPNLDAGSIYEVPLDLEREGLAKVVCRRLSLTDSEPDLTEWRNMVDKIKSLRDKPGVTVALVGKYVALHDAYLSVMEALYHGGIANDCNVKIKWVDSEEVTDENAASYFNDVDGIIVPGGFGDRGIEGMIATSKFAREHKMPYFGICLGMQISIIDYARNVLGFSDANSEEIAPDSEHQVIHLMPDQIDVDKMGGTLRLGLYPCKVSPTSMLHEIYNEELIYERHRHRYEVNNEYRKALVENGMTISGVSPDDRLVETIELSDHPFYVGVQFHPEFKSRPNRPQPIFAAFIKAALAHRDND